MDESTALALGLNTTQSKFEFAAIDQKLNVTSELFVWTSIWTSRLVIINRAHTKVVLNAFHGYSVESILGNYQFLG